LLAETATCTPQLRAAKEAQEKPWPICANLSSLSADALRQNTPNFCNWPTDVCQIPGNGQR